MFKFLGSSKYFPVADREETEVFFSNPETSDTYQNALKRTTPLYIITCILLISSAITTTSDFSSDAGFQAISMKFARGVPQNTVGVDFRSTPVQP